MRTKRIVISKDFSVVPAGRYKKDGPFNGTKFRQRHLRPAFENFECVEVDLDGTEGYGSSFLEESFGGLVREEGFTTSRVLNTLRLLPETGSPRIERYKRLINRYINEAKASD